MSKQASVAGGTSYQKLFKRWYLHVHPSFANGLSETGGQPNPIDLLSDRKLEVMEYLVMGYRAKEIANKMNVVISSVSRFRNGHLISLA